MDNFAPLRMGGGAPLRVGGGLRATPLRVGGRALRRTGARGPGNSALTRGSAGSYIHFSQLIFSALPKTGAE